jgi:hypothetical protein
MYYLAKSSVLNAFGVWDDRGRLTLVEADNPEQAKAKVEAHVLKGAGRGAAAVVTLFDTIK